MLLGKCKLTILVKTVGTIPDFPPPPPPPPPHYNVDFSRCPKSRCVHRALARFNIFWGEAGREKGSERRTRVAHITMKACTVNSLLFAQNFPKSFDLDCRVLMQEVLLTPNGLVSHASEIEFYRC